MSFQPPPPQPDFAIIENLLVQSKINADNPPLYQFLRNFLKQTQQMQGLFVTDISNAATTGGTVTGDFYPAQLGHAGF